MSLTDRLIARLDDEIRRREALIVAAGPGASIQMIVQLDSSSSVKAIKFSIQTSSHER